jgi:hypothetical protein
VLSIAGTPVIPVLLGGAQWPPADTLPEELLPLLRSNSRAVSNAHWEEDIDRLVLSTQCLQARHAVRMRLAHQAAENPGYRRADAALLLLTTFDQLLVRPFLQAHAVAGSSTEDLRLLAPEEVAPTDLGASPSITRCRFRPTVHLLLEDLEALLGWLRDNAEWPVTSDSAMIGIAANWDTFRFVALGK